MLLKYEPNQSHSLASVSVVWRTRGTELVFKEHFVAGTIYTYKSSLGTRINVEIIVFTNTAL